MQLLDLTLPTAAENLALDEVLLLAAENGMAGEVLRLWEQPTLAVVVGAGGSTSFDVKRAECDAAGVPILRRSSGGGTVVIGPGCLCYTLVLEYARAPGLDQIATSNHYVLGHVLEALRTIAPGATVSGTSDLAVCGVKFSGNAQQRKRRYFLHHGTLLCGFDLSRIGELLNAPERQPEYRASRPHGEFVMNLSATIEDVKRLLIATWLPVGEYGPLPWESVRVMIAEKYGRDDWNRRR